jgi:hypothetical protein
MKQPAFQFYTGDWLKDPALTLCTSSARGVWIDLICAMHESGRSGELRGTPDQLARVARTSTADLTQALTDLQATGAADVTERNGVVTVVNRRMKRESKERKQTALRVFRHRHPGEEVPSNGGDTPPLQSSSSSSSSSEEKKEEEKTPLPPAGGRTRQRIPFVKPSLEQVAAYCRERNNGINPQEWLDAYERVGWVVGKNRSPMVNWQAAVRTWEHNRKGQAGAPGTPAGGRRKVPLG